MKTLTEVKESFEKNKGQWEVYGPLGMGINYPKLWLFLESSITELFKEGYKQGVEDMGDWIKGQDSVPWEDEVDDMTEHMIINQNIDSCLGKGKEGK